MSSPCAEISGSVLSYGTKEASSARTESELAEVTGRDSLLLSPYCVYLVWISRSLIPWTTTQADTPDSIASGHGGASVITSIVVESIPLPDKPCRVFVLRS